MFFFSLCQIIFASFSAVLCALSRSFSRVLHCGVQSTLFLMTLRALLYYVFKLCVLFFTCIALFYVYGSFILFFIPLPLFVYSKF